MKSAYLKNIIRTFKESKGRFFAILAIVMLGVGFFAGLKVTKASMVGTADKYYSKHRFYDFRLVSSYGFTRRDIEKLEDELSSWLYGGGSSYGSQGSSEETSNGSQWSSKNDPVGISQGVLLVEGSFYEDIIYIDLEDGKDTLRAYSIPEKVNTLALRSGRMPEAPDECVLDADKFDDKYIGETILIDNSYNNDTLEEFKYKEYKVVGLVDSPLYLSGERGTTSIGNGRVTAAIFIPEEGFSFDYYKEAYVSLQKDMHIYTKKYKNFVEENRTAVTDALTKVMDDRYEEMLDSLFMRPVLEDSVPKPELYVLDRNMNTGYAGYSSDTSIVRDIAKIFPVFFFLIAALVCSTTMTRMIDDERGQIGTFRAMGYNSSSILFKYMLYSGSAGLIGCITGFFIGCRVFPFVIARAYRMLYNFGETTIFYFSPGLLVVCMIVSLVCTMGTTFFACRNELRGMPAELIRPKAPSAGKRILLERIHPIWKRMKFLHKVTARNIFRFKKRMIMMIVGIAGCSALVLTGFGIKDSVSNIANFQFEDIDTYDISVIFKSPINDTIRTNYLVAVAEAFGTAESDDGSNDDGSSDGTTASGEERASGGKVSHIELYQTTVEIQVKDAIKSVYLIAAEGTSLPGYVEMHWVKGDSYPGLGEVALSEKVAEMTGKKIGDEVVFTLSDSREVRLRLTATFENYVWHYAFISPETYTQYFGAAYVPNTIYINTASEEDAYSLGAAISNMQGVVSMNVVPELKDRVDKMMVMMNAVIWVVIGSAGALAFIVLINLSNINITERKREIATIKVLGFYQTETGAYVFRENFVLTIMGALLGLPFGILLHSFVISQIKVDMVSFKTIIFGKSFLFAIVIVIGFSLIVDLLMRRKLDQIDMAESMKAVE
ncbi:MAG: ABC transporter permease [Eubacterium sp.]|nr:ABC transporter permease [Eubacterium sp.]